MLPLRRQPGWVTVPEPSHLFPVRWSQFHSGSQQSSPNELVAAVVLGGQPPDGPAVLVKLDSLADLYRRDPLESWFHAGVPEKPGDGVAVHPPRGREVLHSTASLVLPHELRDLLRCQPALTSARPPVLLLTDLSQDVR